MKNSFLTVSIIFSLACVAYTDTGPKTLLFSPITPEYLEATAEEWAETGFGGFLLSGIMHNWDSDVWAVDNDPQTRGEKDKNLQRF